MEQEVKIAEFKSHLSEYLRQVRAGGEIVIKDRETPIARLVPIEPRRKKTVTRQPTSPIKGIDELFRKLPPWDISAEDLDKLLRETRMDFWDKCPEE